MKKLTLVCTVIILLASAGFLSAQTVDGEWSVTAGHFNGKEISKSILDGMSLMVTNNQFDAKSGDSNSKGKITMPLRSNPLQLVFQIENGDDTGREIKAIYELNDKVLKIAFSQNEEFPADFASTMDNEVLVLTYKNNSMVAQQSIKGPKGKTLPMLGEPEITGFSGG